MDATFKDVVNGKQASQLVITSDWQRTLGDIRWENYDLLQFLGDAKKAGHRVIITSSSNMDSIIDPLEMMIEVGRDKGYDLIEIDQFELIRKQHLSSMKIDVDYAFDDEPISSQRVPDYVAPGLHIKVYPDFSTSPLTLDQLRAMCGLPSRNKGSEPFASAPSPKPFE